MKRVLILAYYYPPIAASGSLRPVGFSRHLEEHGYIPHIVSTDLHDVHPPVAIDQSLARLIPESVQVDRLKHLNLLKELLDLRERLRSLRPRKQANSAGVQSAEWDGPNRGEGNGARGAFFRFRSEILDQIFLFPDHQKPWIRAVVKCAKNLPRENLPELVYATANPWSALVAGSMVADLLGIPFVADFRDPWTRNPKLQESNTLANKALKLERKIMSSADCVIANTEELRLAFVEDYPEFASKFVTITNGYNDILLDQADTTMAVSKEAETELCHFGSVYELRNPLELLRAVSELIDEGTLIPGALKIRFIGNWIVENTECNQLAAQLESTGFLSRESALSHEAYLAEMRRADNLLILQQDFPLQIPGKIYEYISSGRPLVVLGGKGATANLVQRHGLGVAFPNRVEPLKVHLMELVECENSLNSLEISKIKDFSYSSLTAKLATVFDRLV